MKSVVIFKFFTFSNCNFTKNNCFSFSKCYPSYLFLCQLTYA